jgi:hypothetical protein
MTTSVSALPPAPAARTARNPARIPSPATVGHQLFVTSTAHDGIRGGDVPR